MTTAHFPENSSFSWLFLRIVQGEPQLILRASVAQDSMQIQALVQDGESRLLAMLPSLCMKTDKFMLYFWNVASPPRTVCTF